MFPERLTDAGLTVERHCDHFAPTTDDAVWIEEVGRRGWVGLTHNKEIRYNPLQRDAAMRAGIALFILIGSYPHEEIAQNFVQSIEGVRRLLAEQSLPFIAKVAKRSQKAFERGHSGRVELSLTHDEWIDLVSDP